MTLWRSMGSPHARGRFQHVSASPHVEAGFGDQLTLSRDRDVDHRERSRHERAPHATDRQARHALCKPPGRQLVNRGGGSPRLCVGVSLAEHPFGLGQHRAGMLTYPGNVLPGTLEADRLVRRRWPVGKARFCVHHGVITPSWGSPTAGRAWGVPTTTRCDTLPYRWASPTIAHTRGGPAPWRP